MVKNREYRTQSNLVTNEGKNGSNLEITVQELSGYKLLGVLIKNESLYNSAFEITTQTNNNNVNNNGGNNKPHNNKRYGYNKPKYNKHHDILKKIYNKTYFYANHHMHVNDNFKPLVDLFNEMMRKSYSGIKDN